MVIISPVPDTPDQTADSAPPPNSRATFERLLDEMIEDPERRPEIIRTIDETFGQEKAILVLDMSGFSRTTQKHGIVLFLLMIHQMQLVVKPSVASHKGRLIKAEADNLFCLFDSVIDAVQAGWEITERLNVANLLLPETRRLYASIGIGHGRVLNIGDEDVYGDEMNLASKLGEDVAEMGDILLTQAAAAQLRETHGIPLVEHSLSVSGLSLSYYAVKK